MGREHGPRNMLQADRELAAAVRKESVPGCRVMFKGLGVPATAG